MFLFGIVNFASLIFSHLLWTSILYEILISFLSNRKLPFLICSTSVSRSRPQLFCPCPFPYQCCLNLKLPLVDDCRCLQRPVRVSFTFILGMGVWRAVSRSRPQLYSACNSRMPALIHKLKTKVGCNLKSNPQTILLCSGLAQRPMMASRVSKVHSLILRLTNLVTFWLRLFQLFH